MATNTDRFTDGARHTFYGHINDRHMQNALAHLASATNASVSLFRCVSVVSSAADGDATDAAGATDSPRVRSCSPLAARDHVITSSWRRASRDDSFSYTRRRYRAAISLREAAALPEGESGTGGVGLG